VIAVPDASVDIVLPVLKHGQAIERTVDALDAYLASSCRYDWGITVVDCGSDDDTWAAVNSLAASRLRMRASRVSTPDLARAVKMTWSTSTADIVASVDMEAPPPRPAAFSDLIDPIVRGKADVSIISQRQSTDSGLRDPSAAPTELLPRLPTGTSSTQSAAAQQWGFNAVRQDLAKTLMSDISDDPSSFAAELAAVARRAGLRVNNVSPAESLPDGFALERAGTYGPDGEAPSFDFDEYATGYEEAVDKSIAFTGRDSSFFARRKVELLETLAQRHLGRLSEATVLDVGCGTGTTDRHLVRRVRALTAVDVSEEMLAVASRRVSGAAFDWYDGGKLPYPDGTFDIVLAVCVLHHVAVPDRTDFLAELHRVSRHGGLIVVFEHNPFNPLTRCAVSSCELDRKATLLTRRQTSRLLSRSGADVLCQVNFLFTPIGGRVGRALDNAMRPIPFGGQYAVVARSSHL
jgi:SAM-dependent methyltransferase